MTEADYANRKQAPCRVLVSALLALLMAAPGHASIMELGRDEGVPSQQIHALSQGGDGRFYLAGPSGLTVYDGQRTSVLGPAQGLSTHGLRTVATRTNGLLVVGGDAGVDVQQPDGSFRPLGDGHQGTGGWQWGFAEDLLAHPDGSVWIAASRGLLRWTPESSAQAVTTPLIGMNLVKVVALAEQTIWAAGPAIGLLCGDGDEWQVPLHGDWREVGEIEALQATASGTLLVGGEFGVVEIDATGRALRRLIDRSGRSRITALATSGDEIWAGIGNSLARLGSDSDALQVADRLAADTLVNDLYVDGIGSVWVATDNRAVLRVNAMRDLVQPLAGPCSASVMSVRRDSSGRLLAAGDLCSWVRSGETTELLRSLDGIKTWDLIDYKGSIWAATDAGLMQLTDPQSAVRHGSGNEILNAAGRVFAIIGEDLWVGTVRGLVRGRGDGSWETAPTTGGDRPGYVYAIVPFGDNEAWVGTIGQGLWLWNGAHLQRAAIEGLPERGNTYAIALAPDGQMAISQDDRIYLVNDGTAHGIPRVSTDSVAAWSLQFGADSLWAGSSSGLLQLAANDGQLQHRYTYGLGLPADEFTTSRSLLVEGEVVYAATARGLASLRPAAIVAKSSPPEVALSGIAWRNAKTADGTVAYGNWTADVHFYAPWFFDERALQFRYRLSGFDDEWTDAGALPVAHFTGLPAGRYSLIAQAFSPLTGWGPENTVWSVTVRPPWWQHPLTLFAYGLVPLLFVALGVRWRTHVISIRNRKLEKAVKQRTAELAEANAGLERLSRQKDRMVSVVAHDLRTPMSVVDMYAGLLEQEAAPEDRPPEVSMAIEALQRVSRQGLNVIDSMLSMQSIESGRAILEPRKVNLVSLLQDAKSQIGELAAKRKQVTVSLQCDADAIEVECDPARVSQVISNLVGNSIKFSQPGSRIVLHAKKEVDGATIRVQDFGAGIAADELDKIFKPFTRSSTVPVNNHAGLGIGLTICRMLVEQHGGTISIESEQGVGTTVSFFLPDVCAGGDEHAEERDF
jgi:signal transduction histidine kinase